MDFLCWLGVSDCASHAAGAVSAAPAAPEISAGDPLLFAATWVVGVLLIEQAWPRRR
jgi:hypothetical protein